ncbi:MAG: efflux RND transporter periplasmic adaptor subunit [Pseudomonadota bacterium]
MPQRRDQRRDRTGAFVAVLALAGFLAPMTAEAQGGPARVIAAPVIESAIADTTPVIARLVGTRESAVATRAEGIVAEVFFNAGDRVTTGRALIRLDDELARIQERNAAAAVSAARAAVEVAKARARQTEQALTRSEGLRGSTAFSRGTFEDLQQAAAEARSEIARAEAQLGVAGAALSRAQYDVEHSLVYAPFNGVVTERMAQPGEYISLGDPVAQLLDTASLEIEADVPVDLVSGIVPGAEMRAVFDGGFETTAVVRTLLPVETTSTRTRLVRLSLSDEALSADRAATGRSVTLQVPISAPRAAPTIPKDALVQGRGGWSVFVADSGTAEPRDVRLGQSAGSQIEILSGLSLGEHVVIRGNERLRPGQPIAPVLTDGTPIAPAEAAPKAEPAPAEEALGAASPTALDVPPGSAGAATRPATDG